MKIQEALKRMKELLEEDKWTDENCIDEEWDAFKNNIKEETKKIYEENKFEGGCGYEGELCNCGEYLNNELILCSDCKSKKEIKEIYERLQ